MSDDLGRLYLIADVALRARQNELQIASDNLANANTPAFKQRRVSFQAALSAQDEAFERRGVDMGAAAPEFTQGPVESTGQPWDLAIDGSGFFIVQLPTGETGYSRLGALRPDGEGRLITEQGYPLDPSITIPATADAATIDAQGVITIVEAGVPRELGRIQLARFINPSSLVDLGDGIYVPSEASGQPVVAGAGEDGMGQIVTHALEMSNVDMAQQMLNLLRVQKSYGLSLRALQISDQMAALTIQLQG